LLQNALGCRLGDNGNHVKVYFAMKIIVERHPMDPCARITVEGEESELKEMDLLYQAILTNRHKEGKFESSNKFVVFFQLEPPLGN
jgi:hypothetical protein